MAIGKKVGKALGGQLQNPIEIDPIAIIGPNYRRLSPMMQKHLSRVIKDFIRCKNALLVYSNALTPNDIRKIGSLENKFLNGINRMVNPKKAMVYTGPSSRKFDNIDVSAIDMVGGPLLDLISFALRKSNVRGKRTEKWDRVDKLSLLAAKAAKTLADFLGLCMEAEQNNKPIRISLLESDHV